MTTKPDFASAQAEPLSRHQRAFDAQMAALNARTKRLPAGCDQQGRHETRPLPAEAAIEIGADDCPCSPQASAVFWGMYLALLIVAVAAGLAAFWPT